MTKLWIMDWKEESMKKSIQKLLEELQLDFIDLILIHKAVICNLLKEVREKFQKGYFYCSFYHINKVD